MQSDLPHTLYKRRGKDGQFVPKKNDKAFGKQAEANKRAAMRRARKRGEYTTEQLFE